MRKTLDIYERVRLAPYNARWPRIAETEIGLLAQTLGKLALGIEHHGSTAIPGLSAKPIVDILVGVADLNLSERTRAKLRSIVYQYVGRRLGTQRLYLIKRGKRNFNLAVVIYQGPLWQANLDIRDYLQSHPKQAASYQAKKLRLIVSGKKTLFVYSDAKGAFIDRLLNRAQSWRKRGIRP